MAKYLTKTVNTYLILMIVVILILIAVFAVYFQQKYGSTKIGFTSCQDDLASCTSRLATALTNSSVLNSEVGKFTTLYDNQSHQLSDTRSRLETTLTNLADTRAQLSQANIEITTLKGTISNLNTTINTLRSEKSDLENRLALCNEELDACENPP